MSRTSGAKLRAKLTHPIVDADAHMVECDFAIDDYVRELGGNDVLKRWKARPVRYGPTKMIWWGQPSGAHTADRAMSLLPKYFAARMDDCGIDFAHMLTTVGIASLYIVDDELRQVVCRAINTMYADSFRDVRDRVRPVALVPTFTPEEAIRGLEHAVLELGHKAIMIGTEIRKPEPELLARAPELAHLGERWATIGIDPPHDYDPFWRRCVELGVSPQCHTSLIGAQNRRSASNYVFNHLGMFAGGSEHFARALFMGGVTRRFPELNFAFLEGGVAWATTLINDLAEHFEKRNAKALLATLNPADLDLDQLADLFDRYGDAHHTGSRIREKPFTPMSGPPRPPVFDEFAACGMTAKADLDALFRRPFYFGCEGDDRLTALAFDARFNRFGNLHAMFGSDIGHWDVVDAAGVLGDAYELVEHNLITEADFRDFTFTNPAMLHLRVNPDYFKGTTVESEAAELLP
jgi:predicted TIM-barrel fold metal-dependent hydrolase